VITIGNVNPPPDGTTSWWDQFLQWLGLGGGTAGYVGIELIVALVLIIAILIVVSRSLRS
jgi:hypothetical protein